MGPKTLAGTTAKPPLPSHSTLTLFSFVTEMLLPPGTSGMLRRVPNCSTSILNVRSRSLLTYMFAYGGKRERKGTVLVDKSCGNG